MKYFFLILLSFFFLSCGEDPEVVKQKKIDKAVEEIFEELKPEANKIVGLLDNLKKYSDYLQSKEVLEYRNNVEEASLVYLEEYLKLVPVKFRFKKPIKDENYIVLEKALLSLNGSKNLEDLYDEVTKSKNYLKFNDAVKRHLKTVDIVLNYLENHSVWYFESPEGTVPGLGELRQIAKSIKYTAMLEARKGNFEQSKQNIVLLNNLALKLEETKGPLILKLVAYAIHHINFSTLTEIIKADFLGLNQIKELNDLYSTFNYPEKSDLAYIIAVDLHMFVQFSAASKVGGNDYILLQLYPMVWFDNNPEESLNWFKAELENNKSLSQERYLKFAIEFFGALSDDFQNWKIPKEMKSPKVLKKMIPKGEKTLESEFSKYFFKHYSKVVKKRNVVWTKYEICKLLISIKLYEKENGELPLSLSILKGKYISTIPKDYNTGLPVKYIKEERTIIIQGAGDYKSQIQF